MKRQQSGFTLIELMIVVAIIGILAAIAIPSYLDYIRKARATEVFNAAGQPKAEIAAFYQVQATMPTAAQLGVNFTNLAAGTFVGTVAYNGVDTITVDGANDVDALQITLTATNFNTTALTFEWDCATTSGTELAPASCR